MLRKYQEKYRRQKEEYIKKSPNDSRRASMIGLALSGVPHQDESITSESSEPEYANRSFVSGTQKAAPTPKRPNVEMISTKQPFEFIDSNTSSFL